MDGTRRGGPATTASERTRPVQRIVPHLPLAELWDEAGPVPAVRVRDLVAADIRDLLCAGPVRFVVAAVAAPLWWVPVDDCFRFWKADVQMRVAGPSGACLEDMPGGYAFFASEWAAGDGPPVVLLSVSH